MGRVSIIRNNYEELTLQDEGSGSGMVLNLIFRVFNDGIGFRYEFPKQDAVNYFIVADELTQFAPVRRQQNILDTGRLRLKRIPIQHNEA